MQKTTLTPDQALTMLQEGNQRYAGNSAEHPHADQATRSLTSSGQHPYATFLSCADSRVPVEILCDAGIGDLFLVRNAGNVVGNNELGSIEYSLDHLGVPLFVVMSHSSCGAVKAVFESGLLDGNLREISERILPAVEAVKNSSPQGNAGELVDEAAKLNMWNAIEDAFKRSEIVRNKVKSGESKVIGAFYDIDKGIIHWLGSHPREQELL